MYKQTTAIQSAGCVGIRVGRGRKPLGGRGAGGGQVCAPTYVTEVPVPAVITDALPGFHTESMNTARKGHTLVT